MIVSEKVGNKRFLVISLVLAACALGSKIVSKDYAAQGAVNIARETNLQKQMSEDDKIQTKVERDKFLSKGALFQVLGMGCATLSIIVWIASGCQRHKRMWWYAPAILVVVYVLFYFLVV